SSDTTSNIALKDVTAPHLKNLLNASVISSSQVNLSFQSSDSNDVSYYLIYRSTGGVYTKIDSVKNTKAALYAYSDKGLSTQTTKYYYEIRAKDSCGNVSGY